MEMANIFNEEFSHNYTSQTCELSLFDPLTDNSCSDPKFSYKSIVKILSELKPSAAGIDGIPGIFLKKTARYIARPLVILSLQCFFMGKIPNMWRQSIVVPIFKKGDKNNPSCYRPVSLTCTLCKVMEKIISDTIMKHLISNNLLSKCQYGFFPHSSVTECLLQFQSSILADDAKNVDFEIVYFDFRKAFDSVSHQLLEVKLKAFGIVGELLNWIMDYLANRVQVVRINGEHSAWRFVSSGTIQGSCIGPTLFIIYINDITDIIKHSLSFLFSDLKIKRAIRSVIDYNYVQLDINSIVSWSLAAVQINARD